MRLTVSDRIIVHLHQYKKHADDFECPVEMCQEGISKAIGKSRAHVTLELGRMMGAGLLQERMARVRGARSKRKAYSLAAGGLARAEEIDDYLRSLAIVLRDGDRSWTLDGAAAAKEICSAGRVSIAMAADMVMSSNGTILLPGTEEKPDAGQGRKGSMWHRPEADQVLRALRGGKVRIVSVLGIHGSGKTALLEEVAGTVGGEAIVLSRRIYQFDSPASVLCGVAGLLRDRGFPGPGAYLERNGAGDLPEAGANFRRCFASARFALMLDDCDRAPVTAMPAFALLAEAVRGTGSVIVTTSARKPEFYSVRDVSVEGDVAEVKLAPLDGEAATAIFAAYAGRPPSEHELAIASGHPLALILLASGVAPGGLADFAEDDVLGRDDDLARLCRFASVLRKAFDPDELEEFGFSGAANARRMLVFESDPGGGCLLHPAISAMLRGSSGARVRRGLHSRAADFYIWEGDEPLEALHHLVAAGELGKAAELAVAERDALLASGSQDELADLLETALSKRDGAVELAEVAAWALNAAGRWDRALELADGIMKRTPGSETALRAVVLAAKIEVKRGDYGAAMRLLDGALGGEAEPGTMAQAHFTTAIVLRMLSRNAEALEHCESAERLAREAGDRATHGRALMERAMVSEALGDGEAALRTLDEADREFRELDSHRDIISCAINRGFLLAFEERFGEAVTVLDGAIKLADATGQYRLKGYAEADLAHILNSLRDHERALDLATDAVQIFSGLGEPMMLAVSLYNRGMACAGLGMKAEAVESLDRAISIIDGLGVLEAKANWLEEYARLLRGMGEKRKAAAVLGKLKKPKR